MTEPVVLASRTVRSTTTLVVASAATFLALVVFTSTLSTMPATAAALGAGPEGQAWILSSMSIGLGVALLPAGAVADDLGRRRALVLGAVVLAVASVLCAVAPTTAVLVAGRILAGIGAAALVAASLGLIGHAFPAGTPDAPRASGIWGASLGAGIAVGPLLATSTEQLAGWTAEYWVEAVLAVLLGVAARLGVEESRAERPRPLDLPGVALLAVGIALLLTGLVEARTGIFRPAPIGLVVGGLVVLVGWLVVERRRDAPMIDPALFGSPRFLAMMLAALATGMGIISTTSVLLSVAERGLRTSALTAAVMLLAWSVTSVVTSLLARRLPASVSGRLQMSVSLLVVAVGQALLLGAGPDSSVWRFVPGLFVAGVASGVLNAAFGREAVASVPPGRAAMGSGANNTARYVGSAIGTTVVAVITTRPGLPPGPAGLLGGFDDAVLVAGAFSVLGAIAVFACRPRGGASGKADSNHGQGSARRDPGPSQAAVP
ncbi:MFS transporter [Actinomycetospora termitidis]|uniref:MFS transporter n=1 Tax=Actinomycetospora termitidis TaxID=3053470 RepID=A0ABT7MA52_9PSEU|nr:MFS transporter [Actinomycetospora sp. Odt1-22]MDL5157530.1 MFS transporter [Actinomycetospora sp. Odt1-22]